MKRPLTSATVLLVLMLAFLPARGADKVVERSAPKMPGWIYESPKGNLLIEVERPTLGEAQSEAELEIMRRIVSAVAVNVSHSTSQKLENREEGGSVQTSDIFSSDTRAMAARLPFLQGITLSKADTYWERREEKGSGRSYVSLSVLYPFPDSELNRLKEEFERTDKEKQSELDRLRSGVETVGSAAEIADALGRLKGLKEYFFDSVRLSETSTVEKAYRDLYNRILMIAAFTPDKDECMVTFTLDGRPFKVSGRPEVKSECATGIMTRPTDDGYGYIITYSTEDCIADEPNALEVSLRVGPSRLRQSFPFKVRE